MVPICACLTGDMPDKKIQGIGISGEDAPNRPSLISGMRKGAGSVIVQRHKAPDTARTPSTDLASLSHGSV